MTAKTIDSYGHVSPPRQCTAERFLGIMDENDVEFALVCTAESCPNLHELSVAATRFGGRMRAAGLPLGATPEERRARVEAQMRAGFVGIRIGARLVAQEPGVLDPVGRAGGVAIMVGGDAYRAGARALLDFLGAFPEALVWGAHFAEPKDLRALDDDPAVRELFGHARFAVICSRHGAQDAKLLEPWARRLTEVVGWERLLFGSEYPVALWRNELYAETAQWMERFGPTPAQRAAYLGANARRLMWDRPPPRARLLEEPWASVGPDWNGRVPLFPSNALDLPERVFQPLMERYFREPAQTRGRFSDFIARRLAGVVERRAD